MTSAPLHDDSEGVPQPRDLHLMPEAKWALQEMIDWLSEQQGRGGRWSDVPEFIGQLFAQMEDWGLLPDKAGRFRMAPYVGMQYERDAGLRNP